MKKQKDRFYDLMQLKYTQFVYFIPMFRRYGKFMHDLKKYHKATLRIDKKGNVYYE